MLVITPAEAQSLKKHSKWHNQKAIDTGESGLMVGYNCRMGESTYHGLNLAYASRSGFEIGINTYNYYERLETLKNLQFMEVYARYRAFNLWKNAYFNFQLTWRDSKYMFDTEDDATGKRMEEFTCSAGISQILSPKQLRLELIGMVTQQGKGIGATIGIGKRF